MSRRILLFLALLGFAAPLPAAAPAPSPALAEAPREEEPRIHWSAYASAISGLGAAIFSNPWVFVGLAFGSNSIAILGPIFFLLALGFGIYSVLKIARNPERFRGKGLAWAGLAGIGFSLLLWGVLLAASAI